MSFLDVVVAYASTSNIEGLISISLGGLTWHKYWHYYMRGKIDLTRRFDSHLLMELCVDKPR